MSDKTNIGFLYLPNNAKYRFVLLFSSTGELLTIVDDIGLVNKISRLEKIEIDSTEYIIINPQKRNEFFAKEHLRAINLLNIFFSDVFKNTSSIYTSNSFDLISNLVHQLYCSGKILDIGSGRLNGLFDKNILNLYTLALDTSSIELNNHVVGDVLYLPYKTGCFSLIICNFVLEHLHNVSLIFSEFFRITEYGGTLMIGIPNMTLKETIDHVLFRKKISLPLFHLRTFGIFAGEGIYSLFYLIKKIREAGFTIIQMESHNDKKRKQNIFASFRKIAPFSFFGNQLIIVCKKI